MKEILSLGDSLVACGRNPDDLTSLGHGFVGALAKDQASYRFLNGGYNGARLVDVNFYLLETLAGCQNLAGVILWLGINDLGRQLGTSDDEWNNFVLSWQDQYGRLVTLLRAQLGRNLPILLLAPVAVRTEPRLLDLVQAVRDLASSKHLTFVDPNRWLIPEDFMPDGIHLKGRGQEKVAAHLRDWVSHLT